MEWWQSVVLGVVEGLTEFLPVSSTGHLTVAEQLLGLTVDDPGVTAFTAIIQLGAITAVIAYFRRDIAGLAAAFVQGLRTPRTRRGHDFHLAVAVIVGSVPVGLVGFAARDVVTGSLRSLWVVAAGLIGWSAVMVLAERRAKTFSHRRSEGDIGVADAVWVGLLQCLALVPGVSRSGATISAGLLRGLDRVTATRFAFFLSVPALTAAGLFEAVSEGTAVATTVGWGPTLLGTLVALVAAYATIAWLLRLVAHHSITIFVPYRLALGVILLITLGTGALQAG